MNITQYDRPDYSALRDVYDRIMEKNKGRLDARNKIVTSAFDAAQKGFNAIETISAKEKNDAYLDKLRKLYMQRMQDDATARQDAKDRRDHALSKIDTSAVTDEYEAPLARLKAAAESAPSSSETSSYGPLVGSAEGGYFYIPFKSGTTEGGDL